MVSKAKRKRTITFNYFYKRTTFIKHLPTQCEPDFPQISQIRCTLQNVRMLICLLFSIH